MNNPTKTTPADLRIVAIETTEYWNRELPEIASMLEKTGRIWEIGLVDVSVETHICSFSPSWWTTMFDFLCEKHLDYDADPSGVEEVEDTIRVTLEDDYYDRSILSLPFVSVNDCIETSECVGMTWDEYDNWITYNVLDHLKGNDCYSLELLDKLGVQS